MKDIAHHKEKFQRKILRDARQEGQQEERLKEEQKVWDSTPPPSEVEVEEIPVICRPLNRKVH
ncbi:MAG: hypothetical protein AB7F31_02500 [Parachlamydiales bacterium]